MYADGMKLIQLPSLKDLMAQGRYSSLKCSDMYADAMKLMQLPSLKDLWPRVGKIAVFAYQKTGL